MASVAAGVNIDEVFEHQLPTSHVFQLTQNDLIKMRDIREAELLKKKNRKLEKMGLKVCTSPIKTIFKRKLNVIPRHKIKNQVSKHDEDEDDKSSGRKVNIEYFNLLIPYLKHYNSACGLCVCTRYFGENTLKPICLLVKVIIKCNGSICTFKCTTYVRNNGTSFVMASDPNILHLVSERISRPVRGSIQREIMEKFRAGGSLYRVYAQYSQQRTSKEKQGFNYDGTGKSRKVFKKIKAESVAETLLAPDAQKGIEELYDQSAIHINGDGVIKGVLQLYQVRPFCVISFMESSIRLYDALVAQKDSVLSWDATGGLIKCQQSSSKQILYYELTLAHPNIVFPHKKDMFPRPMVILSDRAQVFLQGGLRVFNEESYEQFLARAYRMVTHQSLTDDFSKTSIHACVAHFMVYLEHLTAVQNFSSVAHVIAEL
ncbi:unnamed protein product [Adineta steineri]|uniref:Uncharacterized protein n=2 Tax=Adineta steineri TaxID=433720 RepID=A0A819RD39_9BILA|nr:unnamed protein product [Adineta steineri]